MLLLFLPYTYESEGDGRMVISRRIFQSFTPCLLLEPRSEAEGSQIDSFFEAKADYECAPSLCLFCKPVVDEGTIVFSHIHSSPGPVSSLRGGSSCHSIVIPWIFARMQNAV